MVYKIGSRKYIFLMNYPIFLPVFFSINTVIIFAKVVFLKEEIHMKSMSAETVNPTNLL